MANLKFETIWNSYPEVHPCVDPKTGNVPAEFSDQCAIRVGYALEKSGVSFASFQGKRCPCAPKASGQVASTQELANWLGPKRFAGCPNPETYTGKDVFNKISGRTGISSSSRTIGSAKARLATPVRVTTSTSGTAVG